MLYLDYTNSYLSIEAIRSLVHLSAHFIDIALPLYQIAHPTQRTAH